MDSAGPSFWKSDWMRNDWDSFNARTRSIRTGVFRPVSVGSIPVFTSF